MSEPSFCYQKKISTTACCIFYHYNIFKNKEIQIRQHGHSIKAKNRYLGKHEMKLWEQTNGLLT